MEELEKGPDQLNEVSGEESSVAERNNDEDNKDHDALSCPVHHPSTNNSISNGDAGKEQHEGSISERVADAAGTAQSLSNHATVAAARKRHRRGSKKNKIRKPRYKWKPYHKLTWEEKRKVEERDSIRAARRREEISKRGRPIAPYNTTQFLMDEHDKIEPDLHTPHDVNRLPSEELSEEDLNGSFSSEDEAYFDQDFTEVYETAHVENLNAMSKEDLIRSYLDLEKRVETLENNAKNSIPNHNRLGNGCVEMRIGLSTDYAASPLCVELPLEDPPSIENGSSTVDASRDGLTDT